jgi:hypothetical protein
MKGTKLPKLKELPNEHPKQKFITNETPNQQITIQFAAVWFYWIK